MPKITQAKKNGAGYLPNDRLGHLGPPFKHALMENALRGDKSQAGDELQSSDMRFDVFMRQSPALAFIKDASGRILYVNDTSKDARELAGQLSADVPVLDTGRPSRTIHEVTAASGEVRQMLCLHFLFQDEAGRRLLGGVSVDITEQKAGEKALSEALAVKDVLLRELHHRVKNN